MTMELEKRFDRQVAIALQYAQDEKPAGEKSMPSVFELQVGHLRDIGAELFATIASLTAKLAEAEEERDFEAKVAKMLLDWAASHGAEPDLMLTEWIHEQHERGAAEARSAVLEAALKPFADIADQLHEENDDETIIHGSYRNDDNDVTLGHCRIARAALAGGQATGGSDG